MSDDIQAVGGERRGPGPGERLQAARIQQGLSVDDVANRMHLSPNILEAIEENRFEEITAPIFVKGYLRAYARIVALDEEDMIEQYAQFYSGEDPPISSVSNVAPELSAADARMKWTTILVVLVLALMLAAWWWNRGQESQPPISLDAQAPTGEQALTQAESGNDEIEAASEASRDDVPAVSDTATIEIATSEPAAQEAPAAAPEPTPEPTPELAAESPGEETIDRLPPTAAEADTETTAADGEERAADDSAGEVASGPVRNEIAPSGNDRLEIVVNADTWADIKDGSGYQLIYDLLRADRRIELTGQAPFSVFLGNGHGVEMRINEREIDLGGRIRDDNTVRVQVGG